jgi:hypothetical protein
VKSLISTLAAASSTTFFYTICRSNSSRLVWSTWLLTLWIHLIEWSTLVQLFNSGQVLSSMVTTWSIFVVDDLNIFKSRAWLGCWRWSGGSGDRILHLIFGGNLLWFCNYSGKGCHLRLGWRCGSLFMLIFWILIWLERLFLRRILQVRQIGRLSLLIFFEILNLIIGVFFQNLLFQLILIRLRLSHSRSILNIDITLFRPYSSPSTHHHL